jgi:hypothetical protein
MLRHEGGPLALLRVVAAALIIDNREEVEARGPAPGSFEAPLTGTESAAGNGFPLIR